MNKTAEKIEISKTLSPRLGFRDSAVDLFHLLEKIPSDTVEVDFTGVTFMSRSFAHEYLQQKKKSEKKIVELNVPDNVDSMFHAVLESIKNPDKLKVRPSRIISLS
ncbi:MAG: hypothetical protein FJ150_08640 [Euryarchaeota archaeon]|nr:hypothetical protein [Euryarchaeota archaeon]